MAKKTMQDMTEGNIFKHLISFSLPMFLGNLLQALYNTVDSIWVGRFLGGDALGAVSVSFPIIFALVALVMGITMATTTMVAQYAGARKFDMVRKTINNSIIILGAAGFVVSVAGVFLHRPLLHLINTPPELIPMASSYLAIFLGGLLFMFGYNVFGGILRGLGDSRTPLRFLFYATVVNIILDPLLIFGFGPFPRMEVAGAALATVISQAVSTVLAVRHLNRQNHLVRLNVRELRFDWELTKTTVRIGLPSGIQQTLVSLGMLTMTSIINSFGSSVVAAFGAASKLDNFAFMPAMSLGLATTALVGQNIGAGREDRAREAVYWASLSAVVITGAITLVALFAPGTLMVLFNSESEILRLGSEYLRIVGFSYIPMALMFILTGVLRGAGDTVLPMIITIVNLLIIRVPLAKALSGLPALGHRGIWLAIVISSVAGLLLNRLYYVSGRWKNKAITRRGPQTSES